MPYKGFWGAYSRRKRAFYQGLYLHLEDMRKHFKLKLAAAIIILAILTSCDLPVPPPYNVYVTTTGNDSNDCLTAAHACLTVPAALAKAATASTIIIGPGTFPGSFGVDKFVTIRGAGQTRTIITRADAGGPVIVIMEPVTATLSDLTISGGYDTLAVSGRNAHLIGNNLTITNGQLDGIGNNGRVNLTNATISNTHIGILNYDVFTGDHLVIQGISLYGIENHGAMDLQHTTVQQVTGGVAVSNETADAGTARLSFTGGLITNNSGTGVINRSGSTTITSSTISNNHQEGVTNQATMILDHVEVENNTLAGVLSEGGAGSNLQVSRSAFVNNTTGIELENSTASILNSTFSGNRSDGINVNNSRLDLSYVTVAFNIRGLVVGGSIVDIHNSIVELNSSTNCQGYAPSSPSDAPLACNDALTNTTLHLGSLTLSTGTKIIPLLTGSSAINAAAGTCPAVDQRGYVRPYGTACDIGAFEFGAGLHLEAATPGTETPPIFEIFTDTPSATLETVVAIPNQNVNCREGNGSIFDIADTLFKDIEYQPIGRGSDNQWLLFIGPAFQEKCWAFIENIDLFANDQAIQIEDVSAALLPFVTYPATPIPTFTLTPELDATVTPGAGAIDFDKDGFPAGKDCDDKNAKVYPGAPETPGDSIDSNCNGDDNK